MNQYQMLDRVGSKNQQELRTSSLGAPLTVASGRVQPDESESVIVCQDAGRLVRTVAVLGRGEHRQQLLAVLDLQECLCI